MTLQWFSDLNMSIKHIDYLIRVHKLPLPTPVDVYQARVEWGVTQCVALDLPIPTTPVKYACCLHEIGHILEPDGHLRYTIGTRLYLMSLHDKWDIIIKEEEAAWKWARKQALAWTSEMEEFERFCLTTYYEGKRKGGRL